MPSEAIFGFQTAFVISAGNQAETFAKYPFPSFHPTAENLCLGFGC
ncbi:hypothetical protein [Neisseria lactamica]|nr:hypothetical protein [Neisseria lactamica]